LYGRGVSKTPSPASTRLPGKPQALQGHPIAPTEFPKGRAAAEPFGPVKATLDCDMRPSGGGYHQPDTPGGGYRPGLTPESLLRNGGQRPFIHRLQHCPPALGDGASVTTHRGLGPPKGKGLSPAAGASTAAPGAGGVRSVRAHNQRPRSAVEPPRDGPRGRGV